ncbi:MAG: ParA family protein [Eubacteriales bacterium]|jgi:chromosome partitioning protein
MAKVYVIGAMKGGTAKTATTYNLAYSLAEQGKKVLAVDFDSQANLTTCFGIEDTASVPITIADLMLKVLEEEELPGKEEYIRNRGGVDFIPASMLLSAVDAKLRLEMGTEKILSRIIDEVKDDYDYILVDTCPSLGALTINALSAADEVIVTVNPQLLAMMGLQDFLRTVTKIRNRINGKLKVAGILLTMCDSRTILCKTITEQVRDTFQGQLRIFDSRIPNTVKVGESIYYSQPLLEYAPESKACLAYRNLAQEVIAYEG